MDGWLVGWFSPLGAVLDGVLASVWSSMIWYFSLSLDQFSCALDLVWINIHTCCSLFVTDMFSLLLDLFMCVWSIASGALFIAQRLWVPGSTTFYQPQLLIQTQHEHCWHVTGFHTCVPAHFSHSHRHAVTAVFNRDTLAEMVLVLGDTSAASGLLIAHAGTVCWQRAKAAQDAVTKTFYPVSASDDDEEEAGN